MVIKTLYSLKSREFKFDNRLELFKDIRSVRQFRAASY